MLVRGQYIFYHIPRTGGTSVEHVLHNHEKFQMPAWIRIGDVHEPISKKLLNMEMYTIFTNIRYPFHRLVSLYELIMAGGIHNIAFEKRIPFKEFIHEHWILNPNDNEEYHTQEQHLFVNDQLHENIVLIKTEEMNQHWPKIFKEYFNIKIPVEMPHVNSACRANIDYMSYYDTELFNVIKRLEGWALSYYD